MSGPPPDPEAAAPLRDERGFTVVEVVVAALLLAIGTLAVFGLVDAATRTTYRAQQSQVVNDVLQQEMEKLKQLPYAQVALTSAPIHSTDPTSPNYRATGAQFNVNRGGTAANWNLVYNGGHSNETGASVSGGTIAPGPTPFQNGNVRGSIYRYVVWEPNTACGNCDHSSTSDSYNGASAPWVKQIIVDVVLGSSASAAARPYQEIQGGVANPDEGQGTCDPGDPSCTKSTNPNTPWTFWLTDTPCSNKGGYTESRQDLTGSHLSHNSRGACSSNGPGTAVSGNSPGPPDLMFPKGAPCAGSPPDCADSNNPLYDYATDVEPGCGTTNCSNADAGLQLLNGPGCSNVVSGSLGTVFNAGLPVVGDTLDPTTFQKVHKWVSPAIPNSYDVAFSGHGEFDLWTRSVGGSSQPGKVCVYLFYRHTVPIVGSVDVPAVNLDLSNVSYFTYAENPWPTNWTEIHVPLHFNLGADLLPGTRLGLAISVDGSGGQTGSQGLEFAYDHPTYDSRLSVNTTSPLPF